jgi:hypothetical protein
VSTVPAERILDPSIPLCFDTNALYRPAAARKLLERTRARFPARDLLMPVWVIAERTRQLRQQFGSAYNNNLINDFLDDRTLALKIVAFDREVAMTHWLDIVSVYDKAAWQERERSRFADHGIYASARARAALLVTGDEELRQRLTADNYLPGTITADELKSVL